MSKESYYDEIKGSLGDDFLYGDVGEVMVEIADRIQAERAALHADIIDQGRKVQIAASGESKYGAMSDSEFIEWALGKLEGK